MSPLHLIIGRVNRSKAREERLLWVFNTRPQRVLVLGVVLNSFYPTYLMLIYNIVGLLQFNLEAFMKLFCIGHKAPLFSIELPYTHVSPVLCCGIKQLIIPDDSLGVNYHGNILSEYTQLFGLSEFIKNQSSSEKIYIFQYRKFISFRKNHQISTNLPYSFICSPKEATDLFPSEIELSGLGNHLLVGPTIKLRSLADNYGRSHLIEDFSKFILSLSSLIDFDTKRCEKFIDCPMLIPAPSLGVTRVDVFLKHMSTLKAVWSHFSNHFSINRDGYQRRVGGFLLERLHSFLIYEDVNINNNFDCIQGHQIIISNSPIISPTI
jgi:hypothetical protein